MVIAIDGPAGSGKSTIAKMIAEKLSITFLNTGSFYRGITLALLRDKSIDLSKNFENRIDFNDEAYLIDFAKTLNFRFEHNELFLNDENITPLLRLDAVESYVAQISAIVGIRHLVNSIFRDIGESTDIVCEGRDITTVVFPYAEYKFYLDASVKARAKRRFDQGTSELSLDEIEATIAQRDQLDKNKIEGSLKISEDALYIDTSDLTINEVCAIIISKIH